jgi:hypothetical protein
MPASRRREIVANMEKSCENCRRRRQVNGVLRCEERRSSAIGGVIVIDVESAKSAATFARVCARVAARCAFYQTVS